MQGTSRLERFPSSIFLLLYTIIASNGASAQTCPNAPLVIICNITTPGPVTRWVVPPGYCPSNDIILSQPPGTDCGSKNDSCGPFVATNLVPPPGMACTTSVLSVVAAPQLNGTNISCYSNGNLQYQQILTIKTPPGLPMVTVRPIGNGLVVSCTPGANGDPPTSYDITVEPNGTHITAFNGMVEQNIPELLPNTTYTVRVIAINCAGSSGVVAVNATTANNVTPLPSLNTVGIAVGVGVGVGVPLIMVMIAVVIMMLYKRRHSTKYALSTHNEVALLPAPKPKCTLCVSELPEVMSPALDQCFIICCEDKDKRSQNLVFEVANINYVNLKELQQQSSSSAQLWYRKDESDESGSFAIVSMSDGRALKCDEDSSQVVLCDVSDERDLWVMENGNILCKRTSQWMYFDENNSLYCGDDDDMKMNKERKMSIKFKKVDSPCKHMEKYSIEYPEKLVVFIPSSNPGQLACSSEKRQLPQQLWCKIFPVYPNENKFVIASATDTGNIQAITCSVEGENGVDNYLWKEEDEHIVSVRCGDVIGAQDPGMQASPILCAIDSESKKFKMICQQNPVKILSEL